MADPLDANQAYAAVHLPNQWSIMQTVDGGKTWRSTNPPPKIAERYFNDTTSIDMVNVKGRSILYAGTNVCGLVYSEDRGKNWKATAGENCLLNNNAPRNILDLAASPSSTSTLYVAAERAKVYRSTDEGKTWKWTELKIAGQIGSIRADPTIPGRIYLIAGSDGFWRSDDGAETWQSYSTDFKEKSLVDLVAVSQKSETLLMVASNDGGVWTTVDGGKYWTSIRENLATTEISSLAYDERQQQLLLGSWQHGLYKFKPGSIANIWR